MVYRRLLVAVSVALALMLAGCPNPVEPDPPDGNGGEFDNGETDSGDGGDPPPIQANPLDVTVNLSGITSATLIGPAGGDIQVTDPDGNVITLSVPAGAVYEEEISLTVISSLVGATLSGGLIAAVDIQPDGLLLLQPAVLTIEPADPNTIDDLLSFQSDYSLTGFAYRGDGLSFHYHPYTIVDGKIEMMVLRFSGYGGGKSNEGDRKSQKNHPPEDPRDQASQEIEEIMADEARKQHEDPDYEPGEESKQKITEILKAWVHTTVIPMAKAAETNDSILHCAVQAWMEWEYMARSLDILQDDRSPFAAEIDQITGHIRRGYDNALTRSHERAVSDNDASQIFMVLILEAEAQRLDFYIDTSEILDKIRRFELEFESEISHTEGAFTVGVETEPISQEYDVGLSFKYEGSGPIEHVKVEFECMIDYDVLPGDFHAESPNIPTPWPSRPSCNGGTVPKPPKPPSENIALVIEPGLPIEIVTQHCEDQPEPNPVPAMFVWYGSFGYLHEDILSFDGGYIVDGWNMAFGQPYATKTLTKTTDDLIGHTELTLWYAPVP